MVFTLGAQKIMCVKESLYYYGKKESAVEEGFGVYKRFEVWYNDRAESRY